MDFRIEAFLMDVLLPEGENSNMVRARIRRRLTECEKQFRDAHTHVLDEIPRRKGMRAAEHLKTMTESSVL
jgi:hypothetical protein